MQENRLQDRLNEDASHFRTIKREKKHRKQRHQNQTLLGYSQVDQFAFDVKTCS